MRRQKAKTQSDSYAKLSHQLYVLVQTLSSYEFPALEVDIVDENFLCEMDKIYM